MKPIKITSIQSEVADYNCRLISNYLSDHLNMRIKFSSELQWQDREKLFDQGNIDICWMCGLPYVWRADQDLPAVELLVAPVMQPKRYRNKPIYFSDVVVHRDSKFRTFSDLRGASWAYNEPNSHSGYNITCYQLAIQGEDSSYFGKVIASGAHTRSLEMILDHQIDASAIDSTVLDLILREKPQIRDSIRVIDTWGPSPIPPWLISTRVEPDIRKSVRKALMNMHKQPEGKQILASGLIDHFTYVEDRYYDVIREMYHYAKSIQLEIFDPSEK